MSVIVSGAAAQDRTETVIDVAVAAVPGPAVNGPGDPVDWDAICWRAQESQVRRLRQRIFKAAQAGDLKQVRNLQKLMLRSRANALVSVRQVSQRNTGHRTAGVDGQVAVTSRARAGLAGFLHRKGGPGQALPVRRVYVPKKGGKRPLERSPKALAALGDPRLKATRRQLEDALTGRFRDIHAFEIQTHLRLIDAINAEITRLDEAIGQQLAKVPRTAPCCTACGLAGGGHAPGCPDEQVPLLGLAGRLDEITGIGEGNAQVIIAELGTDPSIFPTPGHAAAWARLTSRSRQSGESAKPGRTGKGNRYIRGALGQAAMAAGRTDTRLGALYRRIARKRGKQKAIVAVSRAICEIAWILICDPGARYQELGPDYYSPRSPARQTRDKIREIERLNPGQKVILAPADPCAGAGQAA